MDNASELVAARIELQNVDEILGLRGGYGPFHDNLAAFNIRRADLIAHIEFLEGKVEDSSGDGDEPETRENDIADPEVDHDSDVGDDENGATNGALVATLGTNINSRGINDDSDGDSDDLYWRRLFDRVEQQNLPASPQAPRRQCTACAADGEDRDGNDILTTVPCNHACCRTWITRMFTDSIANGSVRCPPQCCNTCFDPTMARDLSTVYFYRKFVRKCSELATPFNERLYCAWPGCHEFIMRRLRVESQPDVGCPSSRCALSTCTRCERIAHLGVCQLSAPDPELAVMRREARNLGYKNCQCGMAIVRTDGCNHMTLVLLRSIRSLLTGAGAPNAAMNFAMGAKQNGIPVIAGTSKMRMKRKKGQQNWTSKLTSSPERLHIEWKRFVSQRQ